MGRVGDLLNPQNKNRGKPATTKKIKCSHKWRQARKNLRQTQKARNSETHSANNVRRARTSVQKIAWEERRKWIESQWLIIFNLIKHKDQAPFWLHIANTIGTSSRRENGVCAEDWYTYVQTIYGGSPASPPIKHNICVKTGSKTIPTSKTHLLEKEPET